jgi:DNA invertase Pin-like site-specific DNA recombinase
MDRWKEGRTEGRKEKRKKGRKGGGKKGKKIKEEEKGVCADAVSKLTLFYFACLRIEVKKAKYSHFQTLLLLRVICESFQYNET